MFKFFFQTDVLQAKALQVNVDERMQVVDAPNPDVEMVIVRGDQIF